MQLWECPRHPVDSMPYRPDADPNCKTCGGHGVCEDGSCSDYGCVLMLCPTCIQPKDDVEERAKLANVAKELGI